MLRVRAHGPDGYELFDSALAGLLHQLGAHHEILVEEAPRVLAVGTDPTHDGREMDDDLGAQLLVHPAHGGAVAQIILARARNHDLGRTASLQLFDHVAAEEPPSPPDDDSLRHA